MFPTLNLQSGSALASFQLLPSDPGGGSVGKESACNAGDRVRSLGQEDLLEKKMATYSSILA